MTLLDNVSSQDVIQGSLGNCYLLSVCSTIAEFPKRLEKIFLVKELNAAGIYCVLLFVDGEAKKVIIDDRIPYEKSIKNLPFAKLGKNKNIWPILIEKAWAKYLGNYQNTIQGSPSEIFKILTGAPSFYMLKDKFNTADELNAFWAQLQHF
ncbi:MAG: C2 family cysteine protease, partial [Flammeovirgaceae bacterium]